MIGLKFEINNRYDKVLSKIFDNIDCSNYKWKIANEEVLGKKGQGFFTKLEYKNSEFQEIIKKEYYPIFLNLQMFHKNNKIVNLDNYNQFFNSSCELVLFITDSIFVDIYGKNQDILRKIYDNAMNYHYMNLEYIKDSKEMDRLFSLYSD